ncbi:type II toxin-antitoxin system MqsA family antitoxin [Candidatus Nitrotoga sp. BS]|uniref:type II toxin-antitoxin system MqsA family antitoxin n=1 Tax=Candidatus Nitrotoga sp. BS TaxID=2890408 RepID=UPI001EF2F858|nr:type II toxin-antitoxin system MqsA family antitoxin [Candidatus Nitrotoga sp. BS]
MLGRWIQKKEANIKCAICNQEETGGGFATVTLERGAIHSGIKHVPTQVCANCGEAYTDDVVVRRLLEHTEEALKAGVELDVRQYKAA